MITIFIPISRMEYLDRLFAQLEMLECDRETTSLFTYVDGGSIKLFEAARNYTQNSKFKERLCIQRTGRPVDLSISDSARSRRTRIATIKNESKGYIQKCDYIFGLEDDTIPPSKALKQLLKAYSLHPHAGFIQGVEMGRWHWPYVGAWKADDIYEPTVITSMLPPSLANTQEIDAGGFYCYLTPWSLYMGHEYKPFDNNALGPDVEYGISLRQQGLKNYIDWSVNCRHYQHPKKEPLAIPTTEPKTVVMTKIDGAWRQKLQ